MTYKKAFVAAIKVGGKILRETQDRVELPFGSEYSILLKNLDTVRMQARISIDGKDATGWLVIQPGSDIEVERFIEDLDRGNRFKFIERTERIEQHRGIKIEDGLVRIEFKREKMYDLPRITYTYSYPNYWPPVGIYGGINQTVNTVNDGHTVKLGGLSGVLRGDSSFQGMQSSSGALMYMAQSVQDYAQGNQNTSADVQNEAGITVPGSISEQKFVSVLGFETERAEVIVLNLVGSKSGIPVKVAKTVQVKLACETCGKKNKSSAKFCIECGTSLEKIGGK